MATYDSESANTATANEALDTDARISEVGQDVQDDNAENEPLLNPIAQRNTAIVALPWLVKAKQTLKAGTNITKSLPVLLGAVLGILCMILGTYILYVAVHIPHLISAFKGRHIELLNAVLIDATESSIIFSATLLFSQWKTGPICIPFLNITLYHENHPIGWLRAQDLEISGDEYGVPIYEVFHITNSTTISQFVSSTAGLDYGSVDAKTVIDLSGFGRYLPTISFRRNIDVAISKMSLNTSIYSIDGPRKDLENGGVAVRINAGVHLPIDIAANIDAVMLDAKYENITIATAKVGPIEVEFGGNGVVPVDVNIRPIASHAHGSAIADMARRLGAGSEFNITISGANPDIYSSSPRWIRQILYDFNVTMSTLNLPIQPTMPSMDNVVKDIIADRVFAYWSSNQSYNPWIGVLGETRIELPNPTNADIGFEILSLVPHLQILDIDDNLPFAYLDPPQTPFRVNQLGPSSFAFLCDFDHVGLNVIDKRHQQYTNAIQHIIAEQRLLNRINGTIDIVANTSLGELHIDAMPFHANLNYTFNLGVENMLVRLQRKLPTYTLSRVHITNTKTDLISVDLGIVIHNPFDYGVFITDLALDVVYSGLKIATVGVKDLSMSKGNNSLTLNIDFYNNPSDTRQDMFFLDATARKSLTVTLSGFPGCTSIKPLESSLRNFSHKISIDLKKMPGGIGSDISDVVREAVFHVVSMSSEATIRNPVSGADIRVLGIEAIGYYKGGIPLGTVEYDFTKDTSGPYSRPGISSGLLLPYGQDITTPYMPIAVNETSIDWKVIRKAIGGNLDMDAFVRAQVVVGDAQLNVTAMSHGAPVKIRW